jgi:hypothetical protein
MVGLQVRKGLMSPLLREIRKSIPAAGSTNTDLFNGQHGQQASVAVVGDADDATWLHARLLMYRIQAVSALGEYVDCFGEVMQEGGVDVLLSLLTLHQYPKLAPDPAITADILQMLCSLLAHRKLAITFVERGGVELLLQLPRNNW